MAKPQITVIKAAQSARPDPEKKHTIHAYRVERLSTYEYQCYRVTKNPDGTYTEEPFGNPTLLDLIMRKTHEAIKLESNEVFQANKKFVR